MKGKSGMRKLMALLLAVVLISMPLFSQGPVYRVQANEYTSHSKYMYFVSVSTGKVVVVDTADSNRLKANGDISMLEEVENMDKTALYYTVEGTDTTRFPGFVALRSAANDNSVSGQSDGLRATGGAATSGWEVLKFVRQSDGTYAIISTNSQGGNISYEGSTERVSYVTVDSVSGILKPGAAKVTDSEKFEIVFEKGHVEETGSQTNTTTEAVTSTSKVDTSVADPQVTTAGEADADYMSVWGYMRHPRYMYLISAGTGGIVKVDRASGNQLKAVGDISLADNIESAADSIFFYTVQGTDERFPGYVALKSVMNNNSVSGQAGGLAATGGSATTGWEILKFVMQSDGTVAILSTNGDKYVSADEDGLLKPNATEVTDSEKFNLILPLNYTEIPGAPEDLRISARERDSLTLEWKTPEGIYTGFDVYRSNSENDKYEKLSNVSECSFTDTGLESETTYYYKIVTKCENLKSTESAVVSGKTLAFQEADKADNLDISYSGKTNTITWDIAQNAVSYNIYRSTGRYSEFKMIGSTDKTYYSDTVTDSVYKYYYKVTSVNADEVESEMSDVMSMEIKLFGDTLYIFSESDNAEDINKITGDIGTKMMPADKSEFSDDRYGIFFKPGNYSINTIQVGFYTQVAGLGTTPMDTKIPGINVDSSTNGNSLINFWRSVENIGIDTGGPENEVKWAASQAAHRPGLLRPRGGSRA